MSSDLQCIIWKGPHDWHHMTYSASYGDLDAKPDIQKFPTLEEAIIWHNDNCESEYGLTVDIAKDNTMENALFEAPSPVADPEAQVVANSYNRISFRVQAVQVDAYNKHQVAKWCGGHVSTTKEGVPFVEIPTGRNPKINRNRAFAGYWVVTGKNGTFFSYSDRAFKNTFEPA